MVYDSQLHTSSPFFEHIRILPPKCGMKVRSDRAIALATAFSGVAATLLDGGTTAQSRFKMPIDIQSDFICNIPTESHSMDLIHETDLAFWDETSMLNRHIFEAMECTFRDLRNEPRAFGEIVFHFCEDFRQMLSIVPRRTRGQLVSAFLKHSSLWHHIQLHLLPLICVEFLLDQLSHYSNYGHKVVIYIYKNNNNSCDYCERNCH